MDQRIKKRKIQYQVTTKKLPSSYGLFKAQQPKNNLIFHLKKGTLFNFPSTIPTNKFLNKKNKQSQSTESWIQNINFTSQKQNYAPKPILGQVNDDEKQKENLLENKLMILKLKRKKQKDQYYINKKQFKYKNSNTLKNYIQPIQPTYIYQNHRSICKKQKMNKYFDQKSLTSTYVMNSTNIFKKMKGQNSLFKSTSMQKSIKSLHENIYFENSLFKKSFKIHQQGKNTRLMKKIRSSSPILNEINFDKQNDFIPMFLIKK